MPVIRAASSIRKLIMEKVIETIVFQCTDKDSGSTPADAGDEWQQPGIFRKFLIHKFHNITILYKHHNNKYNIKTDIAMRTCPFFDIFWYFIDHYNLSELSCK